ncbi:MAG: AsmA family protein [Candidatus Liberibacter ctenarytainae]|uniref:AsmA family protein n=1 Tax=Candidatus Liberibacter ctenarytainae TaxID=2020335 RepID=A0A937AJ91_9HYPH|nr:AsmA family protein [Candidatus Liberibacter ctenarytainae]
MLGFLTRIIILLRRILIGLGCLLLIAFSSAFIVPLLIDWTYFRDNFEQKASLVIGKKVIIKGDISVRILPVPLVILNDIYIDQKSDDSFTSKIERFSMKAEFLPLLSGKIRIFDMHIEKPSLDFILSKEGNVQESFRIDHMLGRIHNIVLGKVYIHRGQIKILDQKSQHTHLFSSLDCTLSAQIMDFDPKVSLDSVKGSVQIEGNGAFNHQKGSFKVVALFPASNNVLPLKVKLSPYPHSFVISLSGDLSWNHHQPVYAGSFSSYMDVSQLLKLDHSLGKAYITGKFQFSEGNMRISHYRFEAVPHPSIPKTTQQNPPTISDKESVSPATAVYEQ